MDKGRYILEAVVLLQKYKVKEPKLPLWHYLLDYGLTILFLSAYLMGIYKVIRLVI